MLFALGLVACDRGGDAPAPVQQAPQPTALDNEVMTAATTLGLTGDPASLRGVQQVLPSDDLLVKLGQLLFFSQTLAAGYDVSCGTCHHPDFGGSDGLSIPVGVVPVNAALVGPGREVDPARDLDAAADGGPNMHRNSTTTFNAALFDRALLHDGRVFVLDDATEPGGRGQLIKTPESGQRNDPDPVSGLLEFMVKLPIVNDNEMRGFSYTEYGTAQEYRDHLIRRLQGDVDTQYNSKPKGPENWLRHFQFAFGQPGATADELITMPNVQRALAAYVESQIFVDTPWRAFLEGDLAAISDEAKRGALLFLESPANGGLGCAGCHAGDRFTDEMFHNVGFPQIGRGFLRADKADRGHWVTTQAESDLNAFRTPSLLNVTETAPYGHAGTFDELEDVIAYHADALSEVETFDFSLTDVAQFRLEGVAYPHAEPHTRDAIAAPSFAAAEPMLPARTLTVDEIGGLVAFLESLSDICVTDPSCISAWAPYRFEDPDGNLLVRASVGPVPVIDVSNPTDYPSEISLVFPATLPIATFPDVENCTNTLAANDNTGANAFTRQSGASFGLTDAHGFSRETWFEPLSLLEATMIAGGVSAGYLDGDCWPDLILAGGDTGTGMQTYRNLAGAGFEAVDLITGIVEQRYTGAAIADLNGDYRRELVFGNLRIGDLPIYAQNGASQYELVAGLPMTRTTYGISFAPLDGTGYPYFYLAHWSSNGTAGTAPALWKNDGSSLYPWDAAAGTTSNAVDQRFNFTPLFADFTGDGLTDLVIASDFSTSTTLHNVGAPSGGPLFENQTDDTVITDQNGMGTTLLDMDNDGNLEWFVTSIYDTTPSPSAGNWGKTGNRLYRNASTASRIAFADITDSAGVRDGYWGWGACAADFDNDGFIDLFHVNGFGYIPYSTPEQEQIDALTLDSFQAKPPRLFRNAGDGTFTEEAASWGIAVPSEGRGLACFDFDRDGDVDIVVLDHSTGLQFFENSAGSGAGRAFVNVRLVGAAPNTEAIGAGVYVTADVGGGHGTQTQLRISAANSNFNSQNTPDLHFGLGDATAASAIRVVWPSGAELVCNNVAVNRFLVLDERAGACPPP